MFDRIPFKSIEIQYKSRDDDIDDNVSDEQTNNKIKMKEKDLITVVTSAYNAQATIQRAIDSIRKQTYKNWE